MSELRIDEGRLAHAIMPPLERFTAAYVRRTADQARVDAPMRTGRLKASIHPDPVRRSSLLRIDSGVSADAPYAAPVHEGARPHVIRPRYARALRFEVEGRVVFAQRVNHPGNRPNRFLSNAAHKVASSDPRVELGGR